MFTAASTFFAIAAGAAASPMICVPPSAKRSYLPQGREFSYAEIAEDVERAIQRYSVAGYGLGHRVLVILENRPDYFVHFFALNALGASVVPINHEYRVDEILHQARVAEVDLMIGLTHRIPMLEAVNERLGRHIPIADVEIDGYSLPAARSERAEGHPGAETEAAILFTSGSTGLPQGCVVSNRYIVTSAHWYASAGARTNFRFRHNRHMNPLPLYHMGGFCMASFGIFLVAGCVILPERFSPGTFLDDAIACGANSMHYLGVVPNLLLATPPSPRDRAHGIEFAIGAGANPALISRFEDRFGVRSIEGWAMTETGRAFWRSGERPDDGQNHIGYPRDGFEAVVLDDDDRPVPSGEPGELCLRWGGVQGPRWGFFSGYHGNPAATELMWRGGWLHSGDLVRQLADGALVFVDRKKNIIRRSGENIAAAEVEQVALSHPQVEQVVAVAAPDELRDEEVFLFVRLKAGGLADEATARGIFAWCFERLAYFKTPGWIHFFQEVPTTGSNKIARAALLAGENRGEYMSKAFDLRHLKKKEKVA